MVFSSILEQDLLSTLTQKKRTKLFWFWSIEHRPDNIDIVSFIKSGSMYLSKGKTNYKGHDPSSLRHRAGQNPLSEQYLDVSLPAP